MNLVVRGEKWVRHPQRWKLSRAILQAIAHRNTTPHFLFSLYLLPLNVILKFSCAPNLEEKKDTNKKETCEEKRMKKIIRKQKINDDKMSENG